jgi:hypothetical protein
MLLRFATYITADLESRRTNIGAEENDILFTRAWLLQYMKWQERLKTGWKILISQFGFIGLYFIYYLSINFFELVVFVTLQLYSTVEYRRQHWVRKPLAFTFHIFYTTYL